MFRRTHALPTGMALLAAGVLVAGCSGGSASPGGSGNAAPVTIKAVLPPNTGPVTAGAIPAGLLQNIKPYLAKPNPYVPGSSSWLSLFAPLTVPYMTSPNGDIDIILGSSVETGFFYSKAAFAKAGISGPPASWADFMTDLGKLKSAGITPLMYTTGEPCNPSWFERLATSSLLASQVSQFNVNHSQVTNGLDVAVGIHEGIISMSNPRYAEAWKLLGQVVNYSASGQIGHGACQNPNVTTLPLSPQPLLIHGKVGRLC